MILAPHVVSRLNIGAKRGPPQDQVALPQAQPVCEVRVAAWELLDPQRAFVFWQVLLQIGRQSLRIQRLTRAHRARLISEVGGHATTPTASDPARIPSRYAAPPPTCVPHPAHRRCA